MRAFLCVTAAAALSITPAAAQTVDDIVAKHIEARGGDAKIKAIQTMKITRTVATPFSDIKVVIYKKRPHLIRTEQGNAATPNAPLVPRGVNAAAAWDMVQGKPVTRTPELFAETRDLEADFDGLLVDWKEKGHTVTLEGTETLPGGNAYKLRVKTKSGAERIVYLDAKTYLDRRHTGVLNLPGGRKFDVVIDYSNWKDVNGVKFAFDITEERTGREPVQSYVTYTEKIEANVPMEDTLFATPEGAGSAVR